MSFTVLILVGVLPLGLLISSSMDSPLGLLFLWLLFKSFLSTLSKAHLGYLHSVRALLRWCISLLRSSGPVQTVLVLWVSVLIYTVLSS